MGNTQIIRREYNNHDEMPFFSENSDSYRRLKEDLISAGATYQNSTIGESESHLYYTKNEKDLYLTLQNPKKNLLVIKIKQAPSLNLEKVILTSIRGKQVDKSRKLN